MPSSLPSPPPDPAGRALGRQQAIVAAVRSRLAIHVRRRTPNRLEGEYGSIHRGRSMDFDDLREYVLGDDVADIDWKATARAGRPLIKRYVATRRHAVLLVVDTGATMAALADADSTKRDVVVLGAGIVGEVALRHGDSVGLVAGPVATVDGAPIKNAARLLHIPPRRGDLHFERMLRAIDAGISVGGEPSDLTGLLAYVAANFRRRMIVVILADDIDLDDRATRLLRRLAVQHEVLFCTTGDVAMTEPALAERTMRVVGGRGARTVGGRGARMVGGAATIPPFFRHSAPLHADLVALGEARDRQTRAALARLGVAATRLSGEAAVVDEMLELLERQRAISREARR